MCMFTFCTLIAMTNFDFSPLQSFQSSLLSAILGELPASGGFVNVQGRIVYVSQQPWVFSGTVRNNILFGKDYHKEKYEKVLRACALKKVSPHVFRSSE